MKRFKEILETLSNSEYVFTHEEPSSKRTHYTHVEATSPKDAISKFKAPKGHVVHELFSEKHNSFFHHETGEKLSKSPLE